MMDSGALRCSVRISMGASAVCWPAASSAWIFSASRATVGASNSVRSDSFTLSSRLMRAVNCAASSEWPPSAKKSSSMPMPGRPSTLSNTRGHGFLEVVARRREFAHQLRRFGRGQRLSIYLAVGQQRNLRQHQEVLRHEVFGQDLRHVRAQRRFGQLLAGLRHDVGHQAHVAGPVFARHGHRARHGRQREQVGFDLAELDAVAAHLDLEIEAARDVRACRSTASVRDRRCDRRVRRVRRRCWVDSARH